MSRHIQRAFYMGMQDGYSSEIEEKINIENIKQIIQKVERESISIKSIKIIFGQVQMSKNKISNQMLRILNQINNEERLGLGLGMII